MNREQRRQAERIARRGARSTPQRESERNITHSLVAQALVRNRIMREVHSLRTNASLHAFTGNDAAHIADRMGRLLYTVAYAATAHDLNQTPEANILAGLSAIDRLMPRLHEFSLAAGALELDQILMTRSFTTDDVAPVLQWRAAA